MERPTSNRRPRAVVFGASHWHAPLYVAALARRFDVVAVQDASAEVSRAYAEPFGAIPTAFIDDVFSVESIDIAFVFSPHDEMSAVTSRLVARGIPIVVEKPAGRNLTELHHLRSSAKTLGVPVTIPLVQRGGPVDMWLRQAGDLIYERMAFVAGPPSRYDRSGNPWMLQPERSGGGSLMNLAPHFVDMAIQHLGTADRAFRRESTAMHGGSVDDHATMVLVTASGREAIVEVGYAFPDSALKRYCSFTAAGTQGYATVDTSGVATFTDLSGVTKIETLVVDSDPLYGVFVDAVADTLTTDFSGMPTLDDLAATMELIWSPDEDG